MVNVDNKIGQYILNGLSEISGVEFEDKGCGVVEINIIDWMFQESTLKKLTLVK